MTHHATVDVVALWESPRRQANRPAFPARSRPHSGTPRHRTRPRIQSLAGRRTSTLGTIGLTD